MNDKDKSCQSDLTKEFPDNFKVSSFGVRHGQCLLLFFTLTTAYSMRACMGVAIVAMVHHIPAPNHNILNETLDNVNFTVANETNDVLNSTLVNKTIDKMIGNSSDNLIEEDFEVHGFFNALLITPPFPRYRWTKKVQDTVLSGFFWGYMLLQVPSGHLIHRFGARYMLVVALSMNCFLALILPTASYYGGWVCVVICRMFQGVTQSCILPSFHTILGKWSPLEERGRMSGIIYGGQAFGTVLGLPITGFIASSSWGWPGIFQFYGFLSGCIAVALWFNLADSPAQHKRISTAERRYIEEALGQTGEKKQLPIPWKKIIWNPNMLAIVVAHIGNSWGQMILFSEMPAYMDNVMEVNIKANGLLTALPFMVMWFANFFFSWITDMIIVKKYLSITRTRKLANTVGSLLAAIGCIALAYAPKNIYFVESCLVFICTFKVATHFGFHVNHVDIAPNFAGTMMSLSNFAAHTVSAQAPMIAGAILTDVTDNRLWRIVFLITAGLYFFTNLVYVTFGTGELADWNDPISYEKVSLTELDNGKKDHKDEKADTDNV